MFVLAAQDVWKLFGLVTAVDIVIILVLVASMAVGFWAGFVWQAVRLISVILCIWATIAYHPLVAGSLSEDLSAETRQIISIGVVFVGTLLLCYLIAYLFREIINAMRPQLADRLLGALFGGVKGALVIGVVAFTIMEYAPQDEAAWRHVNESRFAQATAIGVRAFLYVLPRSVTEKLDVQAELAPSGRPAPAAGTLADGEPFRGPFGLLGPDEPSEPVLTEGATL